MKPNNPTRMGAQGLALLKEFEGCRLAAYDDATGHAVPAGGHVRGRLTIGWGHTGPALHPGLVWTQEQADAQLLQDLAGAERVVTQMVQVALTPAQFDVLVDFQYNSGGLIGSTLLRLLNEGQYSAVPAQLMRWDKTRVNSALGEGVVIVSPGLRRRRLAEAQLWDPHFNPPAGQ